MTPPAVDCLGCHFAWRSRAMAEGLASIGSCPRCGGELHFNAERPGGRAAARDLSGATDARAPHLVLGIPRR